MNTSRFWRTAWEVFVVVTAPVWIPGVAIGGALATAAVVETEREAKRKAKP